MAATCRQRDCAETRQTWDNYSLYQECASLTLILSLAHSCWGGPTGVSSTCHICRSVCLFACLSVSTTNGKSAVLFLLVSSLRPLVGPVRPEISLQMEARRGCPHCPGIPHTYFVQYMLRSAPTPVGARNADPPVSADRGRSCWPLWRLGARLTARTQRRLHRRHCTNCTAPTARPPCHPVRSQASQGWSLSV